MASKHTTSTSFKPGQSGNPSGRRKGGIERLTQDEIEAFTHDFEGEIGVLTGWKALRYRAFQIALRGEDKDAIRAIEWLHSRAFGKPKEEVALTGGLSPEQQALFEALRMTPHERRVASQDSTIADESAADDEAMSELVNADP